MKLTQHEKRIVSEGLYMRRNMVEMGDPILCAADLKQQRRDKELRALDADQMRFILEVDELIQRIMAERFGNV